MINFVSETTKM